MYALCAIWTFSYIFFYFSVILKNDISLKCLPTHFTRRTSSLLPGLCRTVSDVRGLFRNQSLLDPGPAEPFLCRTWPFRHLYYLVHAKTFLSQNLSMPEPV